jgi:hypothetical protein
MRSEMKARAAVHPPGPRPSGRSCHSATDQRRALCDGGLQRRAVSLDVRLIVRPLGNGASATDLGDWTFSHWP